MEKVSESEVSIGFGLMNKIIFQLIKPLDKGHLKTVGDIQNILSNFDFTIVRCGIYFDHVKTYIQDTLKLPIYLFNENCPKAMEKYVTDPRKIGADIYIDDKNFMGTVDWTVIKKEFKKRGIL